MKIQSMKGVVVGTEIYFRIIILVNEEYENEYFEMNNSGKRMHEDNYSQNQAMYCKCYKRHHIIY